MDYKNKDFMNFVFQHNIYRKINSFLTKLLTKKHGEDIILIYNHHFSLLIVSLVNVLNRLIWTSTWILDLLVEWSNIKKGSSKMYLYPKAKYSKPNSCP